MFGETLVLKERISCPAPYPDRDFGKGTKKRGRGSCSVNYAKQELDYEANKRVLGFPSGGYLIGRHPECGQSNFPSLRGTDDADHLQIGNWNYRLSPIAIV